MKQLLAVFFFIVPALRAMDGAGAGQDASETDAGERARVELLYPWVGEIRKGTDLTFHMVCSVPQHSSDQFALCFVSDNYKRPDGKKIKKRVPHVGTERAGKRRVLYNCPLAHLCQVRERLQANQVVVTQKQLDKLEYLAKSAELFGNDQKFVDALFVHAPEVPQAPSAVVAARARIERKDSVARRMGTLILGKRR